MDDEASFAIALRETIANFRQCADDRGLTYEAFVAGLANDDVRELMRLESPSAEAHAHAKQQVIPRMRAWYGRVMADTDVLAVPTMPIPPPPREHERMTELRGEPVPTFQTMARHTSPASLAGVPSLSIPIDGDEPISVMIEGTRGSDERVLAMAADLFDPRVDVVDRARA